jgi:MFS family permease
MVAILEVGAFIASLCVGRIGDIIGRRKTILYGSMVFFIGGMLQTLANGMPMMLLGRIIAGLGVGALSTIVPVYQSEISPPHNRGKLACIEFTGNISGYAASVWVDYFCSYIQSDYAWRVPLLMQCLMGGLLGFGSLIICESPRYVIVPIIIERFAYRLRRALRMKLYPGFTNTCADGFLITIMTKKASSSLLIYTVVGISRTKELVKNTARSR